MRQAGYGRFFFSGAPPPRRALLGRSAPRDALGRSPTRARLGRSPLRPSAAPGSLSLGGGGPSTRIVTPGSRGSGSPAARAKAAAAGAAICTVE